MSHYLDKRETQKYSKTISSTKQTQVSNLQKHIQEILSDDYHTFLQGSYANSTAISEINDVDIVAVRKKVFCNTYSPVIPKLIEPVNWEWNDIYQDIIYKLQNQNLYKWKITSKEKCITVETSSFKADIVPVAQIHEDILLDPVAIKTNQGNQLTYPRVHKNNGVLKHADTNQNYKPMVRIFKNWRKARLDKEVVSSHKIESLVHHVDTSMFSADHLYSFILISDSIIKMIQNRSQALFKIPSVCGYEDIFKGWSDEHITKFTNELIQAKELALYSINSESSEEASRYWNQIFKT